MYTTASTSPNTIGQIAQKLYDNHKYYKEQTLQHRRFKYKDLLPLVEQLQKQNNFSVEIVGKSVEQRNIHLIKIGTGPTKVMLWSQMHGDEATATMALFDIFNFLNSPGSLSQTRDELLQGLTLYFVPMLNPDGAERFQRRNALGIDLNRDALRLQSPESKILKELQHNLKPDFGFNLHDQNRYYTVGNSPTPATISFLAPPFDYLRSVNEVRGKAMRTIAAMNEAVQCLLPGHVAKYSDEFEPRAFGDNIQKWGTSVILVESGGLHTDLEKQHIRQLNFATIISALHLIGNKDYEHYSLDDYYQIPDNTSNLFDLIIRNAKTEIYGHNSTIDIGVMYEEVSHQSAENHHYTKGTIQEIGDMHIYFGYNEFDATGLHLKPGKVYDDCLDNEEMLTPAFTYQLLRNGFTTVRLKNLPQNEHYLPLNVLIGKADSSIDVGQPANFTLNTPQGEVKYAVLNGYLINLETTEPLARHGVVL